MPPTSSLARVTTAGIVLYVVLDVIAQALPPHYSPIRQPESDLAVGPYGWIMAVNFIVRGLLSAALLTALWKVLAPSRHVYLGLALLGVWTAGAFLLAVFPTDLSGHGATAHGRIHLTVALLAFISIPVAEILLARALARDARWAAPGSRATTVANLTAVAFALLLVGILVPRIGGLTERIFLAAALLWMLIVALAIQSPGVDIV
jgi:hypothetical membrane protein